MSGLRQDVHYAVRKMTHSPGFSAAVILTVALAIAANASIFSFVNAELLHPMPFRQPERILQIAEKNERLNLPSFGASVLNFLSWREQQHAFQEIGAVGFNTYTLTGTEPRRTGLRESDHFGPDARSWAFACRWARIYR